MTDEDSDDIAAAARGAMNTETRLIREAIAGLDLTGMSAEVAVQEVSRTLRLLIMRENIGRFAVAEVLAEYAVRQLR